MKIQEIREIIKLVDQSSLGEFLYESEGTKIKLKKSEKVFMNSTSETFETSSFVEQPKQVEVKAPIVQEIQKQHLLFCRIRFTGRMLRHPD